MKIHFIAIAGAIMHQLAITSQNKGYQVTGSDDEIANPARANLEKAGLLPSKEGWFAEKITEDLEAVILGMHARADNPELQKAKELQLHIYSFPEYIYENARDKQRIVIAGSHGKTTTTSMVMHVLKKQGVDFDYLVGAKLEGFPYSVKLSDAPIIILEGDEYPASALEKQPKIHFYHPDVAVITGIAWDHINVFPTFDIYKKQFEIFVHRIEAGKTLIYYAEDHEIVDILEKNNPPLKLLPYTTPTYQNKAGKVFLTTDNGEIELQIFGTHNLQNMEAARKICNTLGVSDDNFYEHIQDFQGAARRLEKIKETESLTVYRDFAHAPSKLKATLEAVREQHPDHKIIACFELHTFSSLNIKFLNQYAKSMDACDSGAVFVSSDALKIKKLPALPPRLIREEFKNQDLEVFEMPGALRDWIDKEIAHSSRPVCLLLMSSGTFAGMKLTGLIHK